VPSYPSRIPILRRPRARARRVLALAAAALVSCASSSKTTGSESSPERTRPLLVRLVDWRSGQRLTLVDESHTERSKLYSTTKSISEAGTKVASDEILEETVKFFRDQGFFSRALPGPAAQGGQAQSLDVEMPEGTVHMDLAPGLKPADADVFRACRKAFGDIYNRVFQLQSVKEAPDWEQQKQKLQPKSSGGTANGG
jgi:hypothetical protein